MAVYENNKSAVSIKAALKKEKNMKYDLKKISSRARLHTLDRSKQMQILEKSRIYPKLKVKKVKKSVTMISEKVKFLKELSDKYKIPQGEVIERLLEMAEDEDYMLNFDKKFKNMFS